MERVATTTASATVRAALYVRISNDPEGTELGVKRQEKTARELAARRGWAVVGVYKDNDLSAFSGHVRPAYQRLLADIASGQVNALICWHHDRLHRSSLELNHFIDLIHATGCQVEMVQAGPLDLTTATGRMNARNVGNYAQYESEHKSERLKAKHRELADAGKDGGSGRPFGYEKDRKTLRPKEAALIREAADRVIQGEALRSICRDWEKRGIKSVKGMAWSIHPLKRMLMSARIAGRRERNTDADGKRYLIGFGSVKAVWPGIIPVAQSNRLRAILSDPNRRLNKHGTKYLLTGGIARCGLCGAPMVARPKQNWRKGQPSIPSIVCAKGPGFKGCGGIRIASGPLEALVVEKLLLAVDGGALVRALRGTGEDRKAVTELAAVEQKLADLAEDWAADRLTRGEWEAARRALVGRQEALRRRVETSRRSVGLDGLPDPLRTAWPSLELHRQRAIVSALMEKVEIGRGVPGLNKFDKRRVSIKWKA